MKANTSTCPWILKNFFSIRSHKKNKEVYVFIYSYVLFNDNTTTLILEVKEKIPHTND